MLYWIQQKVTAIVAIIRDETVRFAEDRCLRKRLAEADARAVDAFPRQ